MIEKVTVRRALEFAVEAEKVGAEFYTRLSEIYGDDDELHEMFTLLARDEQRHARQIGDILAELPAEAGGELPEDEAAYLRAIATAEFFYGRNDPLAALDGTPERDDVLELAHDLEKSTLLYYFEMKRILGDRGDRLDPVIEMEKEHLRKVIAYAVTDATMRGLSDTY